MLYGDEVLCIDVAGERLDVFLDTANSSVLIL